MYKKIFNNNIKLILVSPAIIRNYDSSKKFLKTPKQLDKLRKYIRNLYTIYITRTLEMKYGTSFLRNTYQIIVREELVNDLEKFNINDFSIIYGEKDDMVDPSRILSTVNLKTKSKIKFIKNGGHDIANTHTKELVDIICKNC